MIRNETNRHSHIRCLWKAIEYLENRRIETYALKRNKLSYNTRVNSLNFLYYFYVNLTTIQKGETRYKKNSHYGKNIFCRKIDFAAGWETDFFFLIWLTTQLPPPCISFHHFVFNFCKIPFSCKLKTPAETALVYGESEKKNILD